MGHVNISINSSDAKPQAGEPSEKGYSTANVPMQKPEKTKKAMNETITNKAKAKAPEKGSKPGAHEDYSNSGHLPK
jgi:hypothetical protein